MAISKMESPLGSIRAAVREFGDDWIMGLPPVLERTHRINNLKFNASKMDENLMFMNTRIKLPHQHRNAMIEYEAALIEADKNEHADLLRLRRAG